MAATIPVDRFGKTPGMAYDQLGRTGLTVSRLALGTWRWAEQGVDGAAADALVGTALEAGITLFDTADVYGVGRCEELLGGALRAHGGRDRQIIATKVHGPMDRSHPNGRGLSRRHILAACDASLRRLGSEWIDCYFIHHPEPGTALDEPLRALDDLVRAGKVRYGGCSNLTGWQIVEALWAAKELGLERFTVAQDGYHLLDRRYDLHTLPAVRRFGLGCLAFSPLAGGLLSARFLGDAPADPSGRDAVQRAGLAAQPRVQALLAACADRARVHGCSLEAFAIAMVLARPGITSAIVGARTPDQLRALTPACSVAVGPDDLRAIDPLAKPGERITPFAADEWVHERSHGPTRFPW
jgi:aryl-alcohol dehydrogenase-like predicted oxidoreductase